MRHAVTAALFVAAIALVCVFSWANPAHAQEETTTTTTSIAPVEAGNLFGNVNGAPILVGGACVLLGAGFAFGLRMWRGAA